MLDVTAVVVSRDSAEWLPECLRALLASAGVHLTVVVVDNASRDGSAELVERRYPEIALVRSGANLGYAGGANVGIEAADSEYVVVLNPDVTVRPGTLAALAGALAEDPGAAIAGAKLLYPDETTIQHAGGFLVQPLALAEHVGYGEEDRGQYDLRREVEFVTGALFAIKRAEALSLGGFDEGFYPGYFEETDLCFRARRAGIRVLYVPQAVAVHHETVTTGKRTLGYYHYYHRNRLRFVLKHYSDDELAGGFLAAELARLRRMVSPVELAALLAAYDDNLAALAGRADFLANPDRAAPLPTGERRRAALEELRQSVEALLGAQASESRAMPEHLAGLSALGRLARPRFVSSAPVIGPVIIRLRRAWNWMSTRWYVDPLVEQQSEFNRQMVESLRQIDGAVQALEARSRGSSASADLRAEVAALADRLARIEGELAEMRRLIGERHPRM